MAVAVPVLYHKSVEDNDHVPHDECSEHLDTRRDL
jgi:hypothetical protein